MDNQHITRDEWIQFYASFQQTQAKPSLQGRVLAHIAFCKECAMIYRKARTMKKAAKNAFAVLGQNHYKNTDNGYLAVASDSPVKKKETQCGSISVEIDGQEGIFRFVNDSVTTKGCANKYAMNLEDEGRTLRDDFDALVLSIQDDVLTLRIDDGPMFVQGVLCTLKETRPLGSTGDTYSVTLPHNTLCLLEITLSK